MADRQPKSPTIVVSKLVLVGTRKNYTIPFVPGLNIIHGDSDTGKSSILNLIDYCLGSGNVELYSEIEASGKYCLLEVELNKKAYTIKRDIFDPGKVIEIYHSSIEEMDGIFPLEYGPNYTKKGDAGFISDFFLDALSIPKIDIKQSPSKDDSKMIRLSFRDIFKYNYLTQDDVGSKNLLDRANFVVAVKNQETFKFLHNLLDTNIAELQALIAEKIKIKTSLDGKYSTINSFFRETKLKAESELKSQHYELKEKLKILNEQITILNQQMIASTEVGADLRILIKDTEQEVARKTSRANNLKLQLNQNILLKNDYAQDIEKLKIAIKVAEKLSPEAKEVNCPICENKLKLDRLKQSQVDSPPQVLERELQSLNRRYKDISALIEESRTEILSLQSSIYDSGIMLEQTKTLLDSRTKEFVSPFISQRDGLQSTRGSVMEEISGIEHNIKIRNQISEILKSSAKIEKELEKLALDLEELKKNTPTVASVTNQIADYLKEFLEFVRMSNVFGVSIDERTFLPKVRNKEYHQLTSGGVRTLVSVGYFISLLKNSIDTPTNHPAFLMIDTIAKYLGKTKAKYLEETDVAEDQKEGIKADDPTKYNNMYTYLKKLCDQNDDVQIIIVDNDIPMEMAKVLKPNIVKEFNVDGINSLPRGFIDDIFGL